MNMRQLRTLSAFIGQGSFASTGERVGLSASAISIQMLNLEEELGATLFDRSSRPPRLTPEGAAIAGLAQEVLDLEERIRRIARGLQIASSVTFGFVPTTLTRVLPNVVSKLKAIYPDLQINLRSGLSGDLAAAVAKRDIEFALITSPPERDKDLIVDEIASEPLYAIGPRVLDHITDDAALIKALPFITFNKRAWLGQQIVTELLTRGITPQESMELDSLDTIEELVYQGLGVSVVPQRTLSPPLSNRLTCLPFGSPIKTRSLALISHARQLPTELEATIRETFRLVFS